MMIFVQSDELCELFPLLWKKTKQDIDYIVDFMWLLSSFEV